MAGEPKQTLGEHLRQERERRGITIEQVASATKINIRLLHLLEADEYAELPAKPFIRGFVTSYARFIGIDPKDVLTRFQAFIDERAHDRPTHDQGHSGYAFEKREGEQSRTILWFVMGGFVILGGLVFVFLKPQLHHHGSHIEKLRASHGDEPVPSSSMSVSASPSPAVSPATSPVSSPIPVVSPSSTVSPVPENSPPESTTTTTTVVITTTTTTEAASTTTTPTTVPAAKPSPAPTTSRKDPLNSGLDLKGSEIKYKAIFTALEHVWVRYQVDNKPPMKFILRKDKILVLRAHEGIRFQTSDPNAVSIRLNGGGSKTVSKDTDAVMKGKNLTLFIPAQLAETVEDPFPGERPIQGANVPLPKATPNEPSSTP